MKGGLFVFEIFLTVLLKFTDCPNRVLYLRYLDLNGIKLDGVLLKIILIDLDSTKHGNLFTRSFFSLSRSVKYTTMS